MFISAAGSGDHSEGYQSPTCSIAPLNPTGVAVSCSFRHKFLLEIQDHPIITVGYNDIMLKYTWTLIA